MPVAPVIPVEAVRVEDVRPFSAAATEDRVEFDESLEAWPNPPAGWAAVPPKGSGQHVHKTWISPTGDTAYGVIRFRLPLPVGEDFVLWGFLREMKRTEGDSRLIEKRDDPSLPGLRFVAEGGKYRVRTNLVVRGFRGWCVYAGTLRGRPDNEAELAQSVRSRDATRLGK